MDNFITFLKIVNHIFCKLMPDIYFVFDFIQEYWKASIITITFFILLLFIFIKPRTRHFITMLYFVILIMADNYLCYAIAAGTLSIFLIDYLGDKTLKLFEKIWHIYVVVGLSSQEKSDRQQNMIIKDNKNPDENNKTGQTTEKEQLYKQSEEDSVITYSQTTNEIANNNTVKEMEISEYLKNGKIFANFENKAWEYAALETGIQFEFYKKIINGDNYLNTDGFKRINGRDEILEIKVIYSNNKLLIMDTLKKRMIEVFSFYEQNFPKTKVNINFIIICDDSNITSEQELNDFIADKIKNWKINKRFRSAKAYIYQET